MPVTSSRQRFATQGASAKHPGPVSAGKQLDGQYERGLQHPKVWWSLASAAHVRASQSSKHYYGGTMFDNFQAKIRREREGIAANSRSHKVWLDIAR